MDSELQDVIGETKPDNMNSPLVVSSTNIDKCPSITQKLITKVAAEFIGTFILLFGAAGSSIMNEKTNGQVTYVGVGVAAGLVVMVVILSIGHISGAHINPAVTIAFATFKHFPWIQASLMVPFAKTIALIFFVYQVHSVLLFTLYIYPQVPLYIVAQISGSICSSFVLIEVFKPAYHGGVTLPSGSVRQSFLTEFILTFILMFVVMAVSTDTRAVGELAGIAVGVTVILNNLVAAGISGASMNPVRSLGPAVATNNFKNLWLYICGPIFGAILGAGAYSLIRIYENNYDGEEPPRISSFRHFSRQ